MARDFVLKAKREQDARRIGVLLRAAEDRLGSVEEFVGTWKAHFDAAARLPHGHRRVLDSLNCVLRLGVAVSALNPPRSFDDLSDAELDEEFQRLIKLHIVEHLEPILEHLQHCGWTILAPLVCDLPDGRNEADTAVRSVI